MLPVTLGRSHGGAGPKSIRSAHNELAATSRAHDRLLREGSQEPEEADLTALIRERRLMSAGASLGGAVTRAESSYASNSRMR